MNDVFGNIKNSVKLNELTIAVVIILLLGLMIVPVPTFMMDFFLAMNIMGGLVILFMAVYVLRPLEFAVFPGVLLLVTLFRLSLNVATTRMILGHGYAGEVIEAFGSFVVAGNYVVGFIIFIILVIVNFVVITKGATRVAEVAARFTLDAMPGKQMAIDADLNAGLIDEAQAKIRREEIAQEADFYGAMDGASKFVRGDAIAGLMITAVNLIGGLVIGIAQMGLTASDAASKFTMLTIGDGLVAQIPALIISTATGIIITRSSHKTDMSAQIFTQITAQPRAILVTAGTLFLIGLIPGMPFIPFAIISVLVAFVGLVSANMKKTEELKLEKAEETEAEEVIEEPEIQTIIHPDPFEIEVGYGLIPLVDEKQGGTLLSRISSVRKSLAVEMGIVIPPIRIRDNVQLSSNEYRFKIYGIPIVKGEVYPNRLMVLGTGDTPPFEGIKTTDPTFGLTAVWITRRQKEEAEVSDYTIVEPDAVVATHMMEVLKKNAYRLLDRQETQKLIDNIKEEKAAVVEGVVPDVISLGTVQHILKNLLKEEIPINNLVAILESIADSSVLTKDPELLTEYVRSSLADLITNIFKMDNKPVKVATLSPQFEDFITQELKKGGLEQYSLGLPPISVNKVFENISQIVDSMITVGDRPIVLVSPIIRKHFRKFIEQVLPNLSVLSYAELLPEVQLENVGTIEFPKQETLR